MKMEELVKNRLSDNGDIRVGITQDRLTHQEIFLVR